MLFCCIIKKIYKDVFDVSPRINKQNRPMLLILIFSLVILIFSVVFIITNTISQDQLDEYQKTAEQLVKNNFDTVTYFKISQLAPEEYFEPDDYENGIFPCKNDIFKNYDELADFVSNTYISSAAQQILNTEVNGKPMYFQQNEKLCKVVCNPVVSYENDLSSFFVKVENISSNSADIVVSLNKINTSLKTNLNMRMVKQNGKWYLENIVY